MTAFQSGLHVDFYYVHMAYTFWNRKFPLYQIWISTHLKLCLATATHNFKWVKITNIWFIWDQTFANVDVQTPILLPISVIYPVIYPGNTTDSIRL